MSVTTDILPPRYRSPERVGAGGMGEIYRAEDTTLGRQVAIKVLSDRYAEDASVRQRFKREALAAARLSGEASAVTIFDVGEWNERPFIVMEYLGGGAVAARRGRGPGRAATGCAAGRCRPHRRCAGSRRRPRRSTRRTRRASSTGT